MNFTSLRAITTPRGSVIKIENSKGVFWKRKKYTNQVPISEERILDGDRSNSASFTYDGVGYATGHRLSSSGYVKAFGTASVVTGFIPAKGGDIIRIVGVDWFAPSVSSNYVCAYDHNYAFIGACFGGLDGPGYGTDINGSHEVLNTNDVALTLENVSNIAFIRVSSAGLQDGKVNGANMIVTVNESLDEDTPDVPIYTVTNNLTNCSNTNDATTAEWNSSYVATITANSGYVIENISVTMGGAAVTVTNGVISIPYVTGNIVITATAKLDIPVYTVTNNLTNCSNSNSATTVEGGSSYVAAITANSGYIIESINVTMNGNAVAVSNGIISIPYVEGNIVITAIAVEDVKYINQVPISVDESGNIYNGTGYKNGYRIRSGGAEGAASSASCTGFIQLKAGDTVRLSGYSVTTKSTANAINVYNANKENLGQVVGNMSSSGYGIFANGGYSSHTWSSIVENPSGVYVWIAPPHGAIAFMRVTGDTSGDGSKMIVTVNEEIV